MQIGKTHVLTVLRYTSIGVYLNGPDEDGILLPKKHVPQGIQVDDELEVFLYKDNENRLIATTLKSKININQFAYLNCVSVTDHGAFVETGVEKDLFVPFKEQAQKMEDGRNYMVYCYYDEQTDRLVGSTKLNRYLDKQEHSYQQEDEVDILIWKRTDLGYKAIINHTHHGLLFKNETFADVKPGATFKAYIKTIREDGKIDLTLEKKGYAKVEPNAKKILEMLEEAGGFLPFSDKSEPEKIKWHFEMSKKTFKKAIGGLFKQRLITIEEKGIYLN